MSGRYFAAISLALALGGCVTPGGPGVSSYFECSNGAMLKVTYGRGGAAVQTGRGAPMFLRSVPANSGTAYESRDGWRLAVDGGQATWSGSTREAPATCRAVPVPR